MNQDLQECSLFVVDADGMSGGYSNSKSSYVLAHSYDEAHKKFMDSLTERPVVSSDGSLNLPEMVKVRAIRCLQEKVIF